MTVDFIPRVTLHLEVTTDDCLCDRLPKCGGVEDRNFRCPEHGKITLSTLFHTHAVQAPGKVVGSRFSG